MINSVQRLLPAPMPVNLIGTIARAPKTFDIGGKRFDITESASDFLRKPVTLTPLDDKYRFFDAEFDRDPSLFYETSPVWVISAGIRTLDGCMKILPRSSGDNLTKYVDIPPCGNAGGLLHRAHARATAESFMSNTHMDVWGLKESDKLPVNWACVWDGISGEGDKRAVINFANVFMGGSEPFIIEEERSISLNVQGDLVDAATHPFSVDLMLRLPGEAHSLGGMITKLKPESLRVGDVFYAQPGGQSRLPFWSDMFPRLFDINPLKALEGVHSVSIPKLDPDGSFLSSRQSVVIGKSFFEPEKTGYLWTLE